LNPAQRCSWHTHRTKYNLFFVVKGQIEIKHEWGCTHVGTGQIFTTNPGELHEFRTMADGAIVIEIMYVKYDHADIQREKLGGPIE